MTGSGASVATSRTNGADGAARAAGRRGRAHQGLSFFGRVGLAGRTAFYIILTGITVEIACLGGHTGRQADANGALTLVSRPLLGRMAIAAVGLGFALFGVARLVGAVQDHTVSKGRRALTAIQGVFYLVLAYVPASYLTGNSMSGSQQEQQRTTARLLSLPGGQVIVFVAGLVFIGVCAQQIRGALRQDFTDGLDLARAPRMVRSLAGGAGTVGITARALVFMPVGLFLMIAAVQSNPGRSLGTDAELLSLSGHPWGIAVLAVVAVGLATFVVFSAIETGYRVVISSR